MVANGSGGQKVLPRFCALLGPFATLIGPCEVEKPNDIAEKFMAAAARVWRDYFWLHARSALRQIGLTDRNSDARRVLRWIRARRLEEISIKHVRRDALSQRLDASQTVKLLQGIADAGWLREKTKTGGRPARRWEVNSKLFEDAGSAASAESR